MSAAKIDRSRRAPANTSGPSPSFRQLCHSLEASSSNSTTTVLRSQLREALPTFLACGGAFPGPSPSSKAKESSESVTLRSGRVVRFDSKQKALHSAISQLHKMDESEVVVMLRVFFDSDDTNLDLLSTSSGEFFSPLQQRTSGRRKRGPMDESRGDEGITTKFFDAFTAFYFEERLYVLRCISALVRIADDSFHDLNDVAREALDEFADNEFAAKCLGRFQQLCQQELVEEVREVPRYSVFWSKHGLREQLALLEVVFLLYYSRLETTGPVVKGILDIVQSTDFGRAQATVGFFDAEAGQLVDCIASFLVLLAVESIELEKCMEGLDLHSRSRHVATEPDKRLLVDSPDTLELAVDFLQTSTHADVLRAPLLLSFALLLSRVDAALMEWQEARPTEALPAHLKALQVALQRRGGAGTIWPDFVSAALTPALDLFGTLNAIVTSPLFCTDSPVSNVFTLAVSSSLALRAVFKGLVLSVTQLIRPEYIQDYDGLVSVWKNTFSSQDSDAMRISQGNADSTAALCAQFWETDFDHSERRALLSMATRRFPVSFSPLVILCQALSGDCGGERSTADDHSLRASTAVLGYLAQINTLAQVMPTSPSLSLPYEPVPESPPSVGVLYRATRPIPVFGKHLIIPIGTLGRMVSQIDQAPVVIVWELSGAGYSAWRLIRDVLASFVGQLDTQSLWKTAANGDNDESAVFHDKEPVALFAALAPEEGTGFDGDVAADALNLLCSIMSGGRYLSATLLGHLNGDDVGIVEPCQPTSTLSKPSLIDIALRILDQSLDNPSTASRVILAALRLLRLLVNSMPESVWKGMRATNALTGSPGILPFSSQGVLRSASVSLLAHEIGTGQFSGLLALLDLHHALLSELQRTQYSSSVEALTIKVEVVGRTAHFIIHHVWVPCQTWKYTSIRQQMEIGRRCIAFFDALCGDNCLRVSPITQPLVELMYGCFLAPTAPSLVFTPLIHTLTSGQRSIDVLQRGTRQVEAELARGHLESSLRFALTVMQKQGQSGTSLGTFEALIFDRSRTAPKVRQDAILATAKLTSMPHSLAINVEAVKMMTCLCRAAANAPLNQASTLVAYLGSLTDVEKLMNSLLEIVEDPGHDQELAVQTWNLLAAIVDTQPALATLLLTGRHLALSVERQLAASENETQDAPTPSTIRSAIDLAKTVVLNWKVSHASDTVKAVEVLEGALKFLNVAWKHALEHRHAFFSLRTHKQFWTEISQLAQADVSEVPTLPPTAMKYGGGESDSNESARRFALKRMCGARALELLASDVEMGPQLAESKTEGRGLAYDRVSEILSKPAVLTGVLQAALRFPCDALMHDDVLSRLRQTFPELAMDDFRCPTRRDDFDYTRRFGGAYVYDVAQLQVKLLGFAPSVEEEMERGEGQSEALEQALLLVAGLNLDWTMIDAQGSYLATWTALLTTISKPILNQMERPSDVQLTNKIRQAALDAWIECAKTTAREEVESEITLGIHSQRVALLSILLKLSWSASATEGQGNADDVGRVRDAMGQVEQILTHPLFRVEDGVRNRASFPRHVFEMVFLAAHKYRQVRTRLAEEQPTAGGKGEVLRGMQQSAEVYALHTITCLRATIDNAWASSSSHETSRDEAIAGADEDLALFTSLLEVLVSPGSAITPHIWAPRFQTTSLLPAALDLFSRSPLQRQPTALESAEDLLASGVTPVYSDSLLTFFFHLACLRSTAELLVLSGVVNSICGNSLSSLIDSSGTEIPPRLANTSYENPTHSCWLQMLRTVVALAVNLEGPLRQRFLQSEAWSFFKVYERNLNQSLNVRVHVRATTTMAKKGEASQAESIRVNQLEEVDVVLQFYLHMIRARINHLDGHDNEAGSAKDHLRKLFDNFLTMASIQLQEFVHLLQHPRQLTALVGATADKKEEERVRRLLISSSASIVAAFWEIGCGSQVLCMEPNDWELRQTVIRPTISTGPSSPASTGTLLDLASYLIDAILRNRSESEKDRTAFLLSALEQTASLCTTQLVLAAYVRPNSYSSTVRTDLETGLGRDVKQGLEGARGALQSADQSTHFLDVVLAFHVRWLHEGD